MATCRDIIKSAYRRSGVKAAASNINDVQYEVGIELLQDMYYGFISGGMFGRADDVLVESATYTAAENQRIYVGVDPCTVTIPEVFNDRGVNRRPKAGAFIIHVLYDGTMKAYLWDAWSQAWVLCSSLALDDVAPLGDEYGESIKNLLAVKIADDVGSPVSPLLLRRAATAKMSLASRFSDERVEGKGYY